MWRGPLQRLPNLIAELLIPLGPRGKVPYCREPVTHLVVASAVGVREVVAEGTGSRTLDEWFELEPGSGTDTLSSISCSSIEFPDDRPITSFPYASAICRELSIENRR
jgi:hypothetical protein